jgi:hypothetical protein
MLRLAGWALVYDDPLHPADAIVVAIDSGGAGVLEAADLVRSGISNRVVLFADLPDEVDREFARRGLPRENEVSRQLQRLEALGIGHVEQISAEIAGTEDEGRILPGWCDAQHVRSIVVVSRSDHTRRLRRVLRRAMGSQRTTVMVRSARHSDFDPDRWWEKRSGVRTGIVELEKLLFDVVRHPFS